jgi:hypothetical protein
MSFFVKDDGPKFERCPTGLHLARCYRIIDLGTQKGTYQGHPKLTHKLMICWEVFCTNDDGTPHRMADGRPFGVNQTYTLSWSEKSNLRADLQSWRGRPFTPEEMKRFDLANVLGKYCMVNIIQREHTEGNIFTNVDGITPVPGVIKAQGLPEPVNPDGIFNLGEPDMALFKTFSPKLQDKIRSSPEWRAYEDQENHGAQANHEADGREEIDSDLPF